MAEAVTLAKIAGTTEVDKALGNAAFHGRFAHQDLPSILNVNVQRTIAHAADETRSLTRAPEPGQPWEPDRSPHHRSRTDEPGQTPAGGASPNLTLPPMTRTGIFTPEPIPATSSILRASTGPIVWLQLFTLFRRSGRCRPGSGGATLATQPP